MVVRASAHNAAFATQIVGRIFGALGWHFCSSLAGGTVCSHVPTEEGSIAGQGETDLCAQEHV